MFCFIVLSFDKLLSVFELLFVRVVLFLTLNYSIAGKREGIMKMLCVFCGDWGNLRQPSSRVPASWTTQFLRERNKVRYGTGIK